MSSTPKSSPPATFGQWVLGCVLGVQCVALLWQLVRRWEIGPACCGPWSADQHLLLVVGLAGAFGGALHALSSFVTYVGAGRFRSSWTVWYFWRAPLGAGLAMGVYLSIRAGLMTGAQSPSEVNQFGFAGVAVLTGLFNRYAYQKLLKVAEAFFTKPEDDTGSSLKGDALEIENLSPDTVAVNHEATLSLRGKNFVREMIVLVGGKPGATVESVDAESATVKIPAALLAAAGPVTIQLVRPGATGGLSKPETLKVG